MRRPVFTNFATVDFKDPKSATPGISALTVVRFLRSEKRQPTLGLPRRLAQQMEEPIRSLTTIKGRSYVSMMKIDFTNSA